MKHKKTDTIFQNDEQKSKSFALPNTAVTEIWAYSYVTSHMKKTRNINPVSSSKAMLKILSHEDQQTSCGF